MHMELHHVTDSATGRIYHVVYSDEGLYLLHMTNTDGYNDYAGGSVKFDVTNKSTERYAESFINGEEELSQNLTSAVLREEHSRYFTFGEIRKVSFTSSPPHTLTLETGEETYRLEFRNSPPEQVETFFGWLTQAVGQERDASRQLRQ